MAPPPLRAAVAAGIRASAHEAWLLPVGAVIALVRTLATVPALVVAVAVVVNAAGRAASLHPASPLAPFAGAAVVLASPRFLALVAGLWLAGTLLSGVLRVLFLAGALPTLGARVAAVDATRRFAPGIAWGLPRQVATWLLTSAAELAAGGYLLVSMNAAARLVATQRDGGAMVLAASAAAALAIGLALLLATRVLGDAAAARTAILGEGPAEAWAGAVRRFLARPGAFMLGGMAVGLAGAAAWGALQPLVGIVAAVRERVAGPIAVGPELMLALLAALAAAAVDLAWLATIGTLACAEVSEVEPQGQRRRLSA